MEKEKMEENKMREVRIEKVTLSIGATGEELDGGVKLLERITERKAVKRTSKKRIPTLGVGVRPGLEVGCMITLRGKKAEEVLKRLLAAVDYKLKKKGISDNSFTFGIKEYIEIPKMEYQRDIGIMGLDVSVSFARAGKRILRKKIKKGRIPKKQFISKEEVIQFMKNKFNTEILGRQV